MDPVNVPAKFEVRS